MRRSAKSFRASQLASLQARCHGVRRPYRTVFAKRRVAADPPIQQPGQARDGTPVRWLNPWRCHSNARVPHLHPCCKRRKPSFPQRRGVDRTKQFGLRPRCCHARQHPLQQDRRLFWIFRTQLFNSAEQLRVIQETSQSEHNGSMLVGRQGLHLTKLNI